MDLKQKLAVFKRKIKENAPVIIAVGVGVFVVGYLAYQMGTQKGKRSVSVDDLGLEPYIHDAIEKLKEDRRSIPSCDLGLETHVYLTRDSIERLREGQTACFEPFDGDLHLVLHKDDQIED